MLFSRVLFVFSFLKFSFCLLLVTLLGCNSKEESVAPTSPKLVIGIVVDQMRYDYLERFSKDFKQNHGFHRLVRQGRFYQNCRYSYLPTYTGPGHATIFTGTTPKYNGIIGNDWYNRTVSKIMYCASDSTVSTIGSPSGAGQMSPKNMLTESMGDAFKHHFGGKSKVYGISMKDRGAIFPAGKQGDMAFWFDGGKQGKWITSSFYGKELPAWAERFNNSGICDSILGLTWEPLPISLSYQIEDNATWERPYRGMDKPEFPYDLNALKLINGGYSLLKQVPFGNDLTIAFAQDLIRNEGLGKDTICDFLSLSFSATDYVGHRFGTESLELVDTYLRLDLRLASFFSFLDQTVGYNNYTVFLTSDHGATAPAGYSRTKLKRGGAISSVGLEGALDSVLTLKGLPKRSVLSLINQQVYLSRDLNEKDKRKAIEILTNYLSEQAFVAEVLPTQTLGRGVPADYNGSHYTAATNAFIPDRCGDLWYFLKPYWVEYAVGGSTHGSFEESDIHVPFMIMGPEIEADSIWQDIAVKDIAPTVCKWSFIKGLESFTGIAK